MVIEYDQSVTGAREEAIACFNESHMWMARRMRKLSDGDGHFHVQISFTETWYLYYDRG